MITVVVVLAVLGIIAYLVPDPRFKQLIYIVAAVAVVMWLLSVTGLWSGGPALFPR